MQSNRTLLLVALAAIALVVVVVTVRRVPDEGDHNRAAGRRSEPRRDRETPAAAVPAAATPDRPPQTPAAATRPRPTAPVPTPEETDTTIPAESLADAEETTNPRHPYQSEDMVTMDDSYSAETIFDEAGKEFGVPPDILRALAFVESEADHRHGIRQEDGGFGVMRLREREGFDTLGEAAGLLGVEKSVLVRDPSQNIRGAAALLRSYYDEAAATGSNTNPWITALTLYSGRSDEKAVTYARDIENILQEGMAHTTSFGGKVNIPPGQHQLLAPRNSGQ